MVCKIVILIVFIELTLAGIKGEKSEEEPLKLSPFKLDFNELNKDFKIPE